MPRKLQTSFEVNKSNLKWEKKAMLKAKLRKMTYHAHIDKLCDIFIHVTTVMHAGMAN